MAALSNHWVVPVAPTVEHLLVQEHTYPCRTIHAAQQKRQRVYLERANTGLRLFFRPNIVVK